MKIYLASRYSRHDEMYVHAMHLTTYCSFKIVSRWIYGAHEGREDGPEEDNVRFALEDYADLRSADIVLWFSDDPEIQGKGKGGRHVEFGIALALSIPIYVIGRKENVFHYLPQVKHLNSLEDFTRMFGYMG